MPAETAPGTVSPDYPVRPRHCYDGRPFIQYIKEFPLGKGDRKTRRGKTYRGSYGNTRAHGVLPAVVGAKPTVTKPAAAKKAAPKKKSA
jgi:30S ribosomal protein S31